jgi:glycosyltransferase involved in cell wall biosynthesis
MLQNQLDISVVIPLLNEEDNLLPLYDEINLALKGKFTYEIIFVDDGSKDKSFQILADLAAKDPNVTVIQFRRNFGQTPAMAAGFAHARGRIICPLDADRQNDPNDIPAMVEKMKEGYDIVSGWRKDRQDKFVTRRIPSMLANGLIAKITGVKLHDFGCTLKAYDREVIKETPLYGEMHRFIPAVASWCGARITEMVVHHRPRVAGVAKYGLARTFKVVLDLITVKFLLSFSTKPIYVFGGMGVFSFVGAFLSGAIVLYQKFISAQQLAMNRNPLLVLTAMLITAGIQLLLMGLLAELLVRTYHESQGRPTYSVRRIISSRPAEDGK